VPAIAESQQTKATPITIADPAMVALDPAPIEPAWIRTALAVPLARLILAQGTVPGPQTPGSASLDGRS
jgi:hypothetical protein